MSVRIPQREGLWLVLVLLAAVGLRGAYLVERRAQPDFGSPEIDAGFHDDWARTIVYGEERAHEWRRADRGDPLAEEPYLRPPGYPWFLAAVYAVSGGSATAAVLANQLCGLLTALLAYLVARRAAGGAAGVLAAAVAGLHWGAIFFEGELHAPPLLGALTLGMVLLLVRAADGVGAQARGPVLGWALGAGAALGAAALVRPNALAYLAVVLPWLAWTCRRRGARWGRPVAAVAVGAALAIAPATLRNLSVSGEFVPITANLGINLYLGNHEDANGLITADLGGLGDFKTCYDYPAIVARLEEQEGRELGLGDVSGYFGAEARRWILENPGDFVAVTWLKARYLLGPAEVGHNKEVALEKRGSAALRFLPFPFPLLLALAALGLLVGWRDRGEQEVPDDGRRREVLLLLGGLALVFALSLLPFFAAARYRAPLVPLLAPLAGMAALGLVGAGRRAGVASWRGGVAAATLALAWALGPAVEEGEAKYHLLRAQGHFAAGEYDACRAEYDQALALVPGDPGALYGLAVLEQKLGKGAAARQRYEAALRSDPRHPKANFNLGFLLSAAGDREGALECWRIATEADPLLAPAPYQRGRLLLGLGRAREARADLERAVERGRGGAEAVTYLTDLALLLSIAPSADLRDGTRALALADEALGLGDGPQVRYARAAALAELGRLPEALEEARRGLAAASGPERARFEAAVRSFEAGQPIRM